MDQKKTDRVYFQHLDVCRFWAAFAILLYHAYGAWVGWFGEIGFLSGGTYTDLTPTGVLVDRGINNFGLGVDVFFLISGFLITYILLVERAKFQKINVFNFIVRRAFRIWPLYFGLIIAAPFIISWMQSDSEPNYLMNSLFLGNFETISTGSWTYPFSHFWSICVEEHFYLFWPFIIAFVPLRRLLYVFVAVVIAAITFRMWIYGSESGQLHLHINTMSNMDSLALGSVGGYLYFRKPFEFNVPRWSRYTVWVLVVLVLCTTHHVNWDGMWVSGFKKYMYLVLAAFLLLDFNFNPRYRYWLKPKSVLHYLGKISFGIYMYGNIVFLVVINEIMFPWQSSNMYLYFGANILITIAVSILSYELVEKQFLKLNKHFRKVKTMR